MALVRSGWSAKVLLLMVMQKFTTKKRDVAMVEYIVWMLLEYDTNEVGTVPWHTRVAIHLVQMARWKLERPLQQQVTSLNVE